MDIRWGLSGEVQSLQAIGLVTLQQRTMLTFCIILFFMMIERTYVKEIFAKSFIVRLMVWHITIGLGFTLISSFLCFCEQHSNSCPTTEMVLSINMVH